MVNICLEHSINMVNYTKLAVDVTGELFQTQLHLNFPRY